MEIIDKIKTHFEEHKIAYSMAATAVVTAGITCLVMRGRYEGLGNAGPYGLETADNSVTMRSFFSFAKQESNITSTIHRGGSGSPSYIIKCVEFPNVAWLSQRSAAIDTGVSQPILSKHLNGLLPDANGLHFERIGVAVA